MENDDTEDAIYFFTLVTFWSVSYVRRPTASYIVNFIDRKNPPYYNAKKHRLPILSFDTFGMLDYRSYVRA